MAAGLLPSRRQELSRHRVTRTVFVELLTSRRQLTRLDDGPNRLRGLVDGLGNWYTIETGVLTTGAVSSPRILAEGTIARNRFGDCG